MCLVYHQPEIEILIIPSYLDLLKNNHQNKYKFSNSIHKTNNQHKIINQQKISNNSLDKNKIIYSIKTI